MQKHGGFSLSKKVYFQHRRVCIREAFPLEGEGGFSGAGRKKTRMRVCFHRTLQLNRLFADAHTPHLSATPPPSPHVGKALLFSKSFYSHTRFRFIYTQRQPLVSLVHLLSLIASIVQDVLY